MKVLKWTSEGWGDVTDTVSDEFLADTFQICVYHEKRSVSDASDGKDKK